MNEAFYDMVDGKIKELEPYKDLQELFKSAHQFCKENGGHIIPFDRPRQLKLGWLHFETGTFWTIKIPDLKRSYVLMNDPSKRRLVEEALQSDTGKLNLCSAMCGQDVNTFYSELEEKYKEDSE